MKKTKYRTPRIEEFVEGFEYQVAYTTRLDIIDFSNMENIIEGEWQTSWYDRVVPNLDPIVYPHKYTDEMGIHWTIINDPFPGEDKLKSVKVGIKNKTIRTKKL